ncbi:MAG: hypothetical protein PHE89_04980 [Alphaproteobacteria bacterium]|nr:hypothetical protein [Alphaproteobacteria bacterium]
MINAQQTNGDFYKTCRCETEKLTYTRDSCAAESTNKEVGGDSCKDTYFEKCECKSQYKYTATDCSKDGKIQSSDKCDGKSSSCVCDSKYQYSSCTSPKTLSGDSCGGKYESCSCPSSYVSCNCGGNGTACDGKYTSCKSCCSDVCSSGSTNVSCGTGYTKTQVSTTECGTSCYSCVSNCVSGGSSNCSGSTSCSSNQVATSSCTNCSGSTLYSCRNKTCAEGGYSASQPSGQTCSTVSYNGNTCYTGCAATCATGGSASCTGVSSCSSSQVSTGSCKNCAGSTLYTCRNKTCVEGGYLASVPSGQTCSSVTYNGSTCYTSCAATCTPLASETGCSYGSYSCSNGCSGTRTCCYPACTGAYTYGFTEADCFFRPYKMLQQPNNPNCKTCDCDNSLDACGGTPCVCAII